MAHSRPSRAGPLQDLGRPPTSIVPRRTLRKRLRAEQTNLQRLVSQTRFELAKQLLQYTRLSTSEIAMELRYADLSTFSRAFKSWAKISPRQYRLMP